MKKLLFPFSTIFILCTSNWVLASYSDLHQELDEYAPPMAIESAPRPVTPDNSPPDTFTTEKKIIDVARDRWTRMIQKNRQTEMPPSISPELIDTVGDDQKAVTAIQNHFSLPVVEAFILFRNQKVKGAATRFEAAIEGFSQVTQMDEVLRQYSAFTEGAMAGIGSGRMADNIQMKFPFPGVMALKSQIVEKNVETAQYQSSRVRRDTIAQGRKAYWDLVFIYQARQITRETLNRLNHLESVATKLYEAGQASYQDLISIQIRSEKLEELLNTYQKQQRNHEIELLTLMNLPLDVLLGRPTTTIPESIVPELESLYLLALEKRQELNQMRAMVGKMERMVEMAETMIQPSVSPGYSYYDDQSVHQTGTARMKPTFTHTASPTFGKGLPKNAWFGSQDAFLRETRLKLNALKSELSDAESRTRLMVREGWFNMDRAYRERRIYNDRLISLSQASLEISTQEYESGNASFADVVTAYTSWLDLNLASARRNSDLGLTRAELERRVGAPLSLLPEDK